MRLITMEDYDKAATMCGVKLISFEEHPKQNFLRITLSPECSEGAYQKFKAIITRYRSLGMDFEILYK